MMKCEIDSDLTKIARQKAPSNIYLYQIAKWYTEMTKCKVVFTELHEVKGACHGFETALESRIVKKSMQRRIQWIQSVLNKQ